MANVWQATTNKKLHYARIQLEAWMLADELEAPAFCEGFVVQVELAWRSLLAELLDSYGITVASLLDFAEARELVESKNESASEFRQLQPIREQGWLLQVENAYNGLFLPFQAMVVNEPQGLIPSVRLDQGNNVAELSSASEGRVVLESLKELVGHFRNFNLEW